MIRYFEEKPSRPFQNILLELILGFPVQVSSEIGESVVEELYPVEMF